MTEHSVTDLSSGVVCTIKQSSDEVIEQLMDTNNSVEDNQIETSHLMNSSEDRSENSGRAMFRGQDMAFLIINGIQMFTLYEIMTKLCPGANRGTVGNRFTRLNATRHACNRKEIIRVKELGGTNQNFYNCTLVARADVERYLEKYANTKRTQRKTRSSGPGNEESKILCTIEQESKEMETFVTMEPPRDINLDISTVSNFSDGLSVKKNDTKNNPQDFISDNNDKKVDEECFATSLQKQDIIKRKKIKDIAHHTKANKTKKKQVKNEKTKPSLIKGKARKKPAPKAFFPLESLSKCLKLSKGDKIAQNVSNFDMKSTSSCNKNISTQDSAESNILCSQKRKRRTQFEMLQSYQFYTIAGPDENLENEGKETSVNDDDNHDQQLKPDSVTLNIIDAQNASEQFLWQGVKPDDYKQDLPQLDDNNNISEPRSPTLLLKRSQNNKWRVANQVLPRIIFEDIDPEPKCEREVKGKSTNTPAESTKASEMTKVKDKQKVGIKRKSSYATAVDPSKKKTKVKEDLRPSKKKIGKKQLKKVNESDKKHEVFAANSRQVEFGEHVKTSSSGEALSSNLATTDLNRQPDDTFVGSEPKHQDGRKHSPLLKDSVSNSENTYDASKDKGDCNTKNVVKKKRRRRVDNTFRLIDTIPYPSLLVVKDGDLCPLYTMTYDEKNYLPGCCHPLWRWRLGKPVKIPSQSPIKTMYDEFSKDDLQNNENEETIRLKENDVLSKENINSDVLTVAIMSETNCVQN